MPRQGQFIQINNWSGGLADSSVLGLKGSFYTAQGVNIHSQPGLITPNQALKLDSGTTVTEQLNAVVYGSDGNTYWFGSAGNIYQRTSLGAWSIVYTDANGAILGAAQWGGRLWWATATKLSYKPFPGASNWSDVSHNAETLNSATWHPFLPHDLYLAIGNGVNLATVDLSNVFTSNGDTSPITLGPLPANYFIYSLAKLDTNILIGTQTVNGDNTALLLRWDFFSTSWVSSQQIQENSINTMILIESTLYALCGGSGNIYYFDGQYLQRFKKIPGIYDNASMQTLPSAFTYFRGLALFGVSSANSTDPCTAGEGVYSLGHYDSKYPLVINNEYIISAGSTTGVTIGAMIGIGESTLLVSWVNSTNYGVDVIDWSNKYSSAFVTTVAVTGDRFNYKTFQNHIVSYTSLPGGTSISLYYLLNYGSATQITFNDTTKNSNFLSAQSNFQGGVIQEKIVFGTSDNSAPIIDGQYFDWQEAGFDG